MLFTAQQAAQATGGRVRGSWQAHDLCFDSRQVKPGDLFIALVGEDGHDGHQYVADALAKGAAAALVHQPVPNIAAEKLLLVSHTLTALEGLGIYRRQRFNGLVTAITGSAGKTSVKEGLRQVLSHFGPTHASEKNYNNHIGTPLSLGRLPLDARFAVFETGMNHAGEIRKLVAQVRPHVASVNSIYPMHIENFADLSGIAHAKAEVYEHLWGSEAVAVYNADANHADILLAQAKLSGAKHILGFGKQAEAKLISTRSTDQGQEVQANICGTAVNFTLSQSGEAHAYNAMNILTMCYGLGVDVKTAASHLASLGALEGRGKTYRLPLPQGGEFTLIDDSYSGQPDAMILALTNLASWQVKAPGRRLALLGQMAELGEHSQSQHQRVGQHLASLNLDGIFGVGEKMTDALKQLPSHTPQHLFSQHQGVAQTLLQQHLQPNDVLLVKGSRYGSRVFEVVNDLLTQTQKNPS